MDREEANYYNNLAKAQKVAMNTNRKYGDKTYSDYSDQAKRLASDKTYTNNARSYKQYRWLANMSTELAKNNNSKAIENKKDMQKYQSEYDKSLAGKAENVFNKVKSKIKTTKNHVKRELSK